MFVWSIKKLQYERNDISEGIGFGKTNKSAECMIVIICILKTLVLNINYIFVVDVMIFQ